MSRVIRVALAAHIGIFCFFIILRSFGGYNIRKSIEVIPLQIVVLEHIAVTIAIIPISIAAFLTSRKNTRILLSFCINAFATSFILLFSSIFALIGIPSHSFGHAIFFYLFLLVEAALAVVGAICGLTYIVKKALGESIPRH
ncbi:MAG: hypothetical protein LBS53_03790 [Synergistaceae bacterium]|jgi:hypothetical protein|nr:hypothetical protein [Synergistaceae bacterium]